MPDAVAAAAAAAAALGCAEALLTAEAPGGRVALLAGVALGGAPEGVLAAVADWAGAALGLGGAEAVAEAEVVGSTDAAAPCGHSRLTARTLY